ncbi:MAG: acetylglutamate kinase [Actinomycetaceae bacterium]|nr:acetylglutamate kinase [Actinomycetaceae bacterium]
MSELSPFDKTRILLETQPWLRKYSGKRVVIKYGGNAMVDEELQRAFAQDITFLHAWGVQPIVVHGGGPQINSMLERLGLEAPFTAGLRVTTPEVMEIVRMVLQGKVQRELVSLINLDSIHAVGLSGEDARLFQARRQSAIVDGEPRDIGRVGEIIGVNPDPVNDLLQHRRIPVISSIAMDESCPSEVLNVNADAAAAALAIALGADELVILTDVEGVYRDFSDRSSLIQQMTQAEIEELLPAMSTGMIPKMNAAKAALEGGVGQVHIIDGRQPHSMLLEIFTNEGIGTMITAGGGHE